LVSARDSCLHFKTPQLVRNLEDLFRQMWKDFESGSLPVPDLTNMDIYHDVGLELNLESVGTLTDDAYRSRYREKLEIWNQTFPIKCDSRLWKDLD
jgi:hypothetical protein